VASRHPLRGGLFLRLDGKDCRPNLWQQVRPGGDWTPSGRVHSEDTA
jgi:RNA ligase